MPRAAGVMMMALLLGLAGCSTSVFESIPTGSTTDCDPAWPGLWQPVTSPGDANKPQGTLEISADCRSATSKDDAKPKPLHLTLITTNTGQYLQVHNDDGNPDCIGDGKAHCGYVLVRYEREGDTIRLYDPDHARVANIIATGRIKGFSEPPDARQMKTSEPTFRNFIAGNGRQVAKLLRQQPDLFVAEPLVILHRTDAIPTDATTPEAEH